MPRVQTTLRCNFYAISERLLGSAKSSIQGASMVLKMHQMKPRDKHIYRMESLYRAIEKGLTEAEKALDECLWDEEVDKQSVGSSLCVQQHSVKAKVNNNRLPRPMRRFTSPDEVPETPQSYQQQVIKQSTPSLPTATPDRRSVQARERYRHPLGHRPRRSSACQPNAGLFPDVLPRTPPRVRHTLPYSDTIASLEVTSSQVQNLPRVPPIPPSSVIAKTETKSPITQPHRPLPVPKQSMSDLSSVTESESDPWIPS
ncbi:hypothetical protein NLI96_g11617 [Meripilus lineatus]|uniref:Uncharacterized protein n=1 Tax=Meripilus lineatus TaxID=2056292 RepID=A0AAD5UWC1_9APHY|nr:hypothetical protein NLI96_g11617 [Physisporinus lineatus]